MKMPHTRFHNPKIIMHSEVENHNIPTYLSQRGLAAYAGTSDQMVRTRIGTGQLVPVARTSSGTDLFTYEQAAILKEEPAVAIY